MKREGERRTGVRVRGGDERFRQKERRVERLPPFLLRYHKMTHQKVQSRATQRREREKRTGVRGRGKDVYNEIQSTVFRASSSSFFDIVNTLERVQSRATHSHENLQSPDIAKTEKSASTNRKENAECFLNGWNHNATWQAL